MKFSISTFILLAATLAVANEHKRYIVTYGESTPNRVIEKAMADIKSAGGHITHQYQIIKGFSVDAPTEAADNFIKSLKEDECKPTVEEDKIVTTQGDSN